MTGNDGVVLHPEKLPLFAEADVVVSGGGPGGLGAALMSARCGAKTILLEAYGLPGGMAAIGEVHPFMANCLNMKPLDGPVYMEWRRTMERYLPAGLMSRMGNFHDYSLRSINKEAAALAALNGTDPAEIPGAEVRRKLVELGAPLEP